MNLKRTQDAMARARRRAPAVAAGLAMAGLLARGQDATPPTATDPPAPPAAIVATNLAAPTNPPPVAVAPDAATNSPAAVTNPAPVSATHAAPPAETPPPGAPPPVSSSPSSSRSRRDYSAFSIIAERNIFDPNRYYRPPGSPMPRSRPRVSEFLALTGTMSYEKGTFAVFNGTLSDYQKVVKRADTIAGYTVEDIEPNSVKLAAGTNEVTLKVGTQMRRDDGGQWEVAGEAVPFPGSASSSGNFGSSPSRSSEVNPASTAAPAGESTATASGDDSDVIKRMMQRREKE